MPHGTNIPMLQEGSFSIPNDLTARIVWQERFDEDETILFSTNDKVTMTGSASTPQSKSS